MEKKIGFAQFEVAFGDREANFTAVNRLLAAVDFAGLIVLPELCFTGYEFKDRDEVGSLAEPFAAGPSFDFLRNHAERLGSVLVAGYAEADGDTYYNSAMMVTPSGRAYNYRKIHLFSRENDLFSPGDNAPQVFETEAGRIGMMICFDWFFPETARLLTLAGAHVIAHPSNLVLPYCQRAMYARSVENHVYTITSNRVGSESRTGRTLIFTGGSQVLGPDGTTLASAETTRESLQVVSCDLEAADKKQINPYNNLVTSRRIDLYGALLPNGENV